MIIMMIIGLVVLVMLIYIANKYILGTGKSAGELAGCEGQGGFCHPTRECKPVPSGLDSEKSYRAFSKVGGCEGDKPYCCIPSPV